VKKLALILLMGTALIAPSAAEAANVTVQVDIKPYSGPNTYLAIYVVDAAGKYQSTLWVAGSHMRYLGHLRGWARGISAAGGTINGISGASVGGGRSLKVSATLSDALINAGYKIVVDSAVEGWGEFTADASVPLQPGGGSAAGQGLVNRLTVSM
jgi:hypothetical protein